MAMSPKTSVVIQEFPGLVINIDPRDMPPGGAEEQVNAASHSAGELTVRFGYREVIFEE